MNSQNRFGLRIAAVAIFLLTLSITQAAVIFVDTDSAGDQNGQSWESAYKYLQDALAVAGSGDEIRVAEGVYRPDETFIEPGGTNEQSATFDLAVDITLEGGYAGLEAPDPNVRDIDAYETILSGDLDENDSAVTNANQLLSDPNRSENSYHVVSITGGTASLVLDGFTVTGGMAVGVDPHDTGGGIRMLPSNPTVRNCRFEYNAAVNGGGVYNLTSSPVLASCVFFRNYAQNAGGGLRSITSSSPELSSCFFIENKAAGFGGAMANSINSSPTVTQCTFSYNWANKGGAINNYNDCSPQIIQSIFRYNASDTNGGAVSNQNHSDAELIHCGLFSNVAPYGGALYNFQSNPKMINCVASGNAAVESGGVLYNEYVIDVSIINCTFVGNTAAVQGTSLHNVFSNPTVQNSILWDDIDINKAPIFTDDNGSPVVSYSCIQGGWIGGVGNIDAAPLFVDPNGPDGIIGTVDDNFKLLAESLCIDAGNNTFVLADVTDLDDDGNMLERIPLDYNGKARFVNFPDVIDTGFADPPLYPDVIDIGALERSTPILVDILSPGPEHDGTAWDKAFNHLQDALAIAEKGDLVLVAQGVYHPDRSQVSPTGSGDRSSAFELIDGIVLKGGYAGWSQADPNVRDIQTYPTILSGDLSDNDTLVTDPAQMFDDPSRSENSYHILTANKAGERTELSGFTITGGMAVGIDPENTGGGIRMVSSNPTIRNCNLEYNVAEYGGAAYNSTSSPVFIECNFFRNYAENHGGGLRNYGFSNPDLSNCTLNENKAVRFGGAMANSHNSSPTIMQCSFLYNQANQGGGAINNYDHCSPQITKSIFQYNVTDNNGGAIRNEIQSDAKSINCDFTANTAASGGAIYNIANAPIVTDCNFIDNSSTESGGAVYSADSSFVVQKSRFMTNHSNNNGGALYNTDSNSLSVADCTFGSNTALSGGALYNDSSSPIVTGCNFIDNITTESGGAIFSTNSTLTVQTSTFLTNQSGVYGGALYNVALSPLSITDCDFTSNTAIRGGAVYCDTSTPTITGSTFLGNMTTNSASDLDESGGAIFNNSADLSISQSVFRENESYVNGGAVYNTNGNIFIESSVIRDNQSGKNGGGICNITADTLSLTSCVVSSNTSDYDGGGVYIQSAVEADLTNCLITHNSADYGGGIVNTGSIETELIHCTLNGNIAAIGAGIYSSGANTVIQNSIVLGTIIPSSSFTIDYSCVPNWTGTGIGNLTQNPSFADPEGPDGIPGSDDDNFRLTSASPCLDAADNTAIPAGLETDLDGRARIVDADCSGTAIADMGAYEFSYLSMGDFDMSCSVDLIDFIELAAAWLTAEGDDRYDSSCDISIPSDHLIDGQDLQVLCQNWLLGID